MKRSRHVFWFLAISLFLLISTFAQAGRGISVRPIAPDGKQVQGDQWLMVVGIDSYITWPRLKTAVNDARAVKDVLLSRYHFDKEHLIELYDDQATEQNILGKLRHLAKNLKPEDSLVIFYAGHGHLDPITKKGSWIPVESAQADASAWISNNDIKDYLNVDAIKAKHILLISDSCFSGDFFRGQRGDLPEVTDAVVKKAYQLASRQAITSGGLEPVSDAGFSGNSVFSHFLVQTLKDNQKPFLVPSDFFPSIKAGVVQNAEQFPQIGSLQGAGGQNGGEIVFFLKQDSRLKDLGAEASEKQKQLEMLSRLEQENQAAKQKEAAEIARREKELAEMDQKIAEMKQKLGTRAASTNDDLDSMLAMVQQKEDQQQRLEALRQQRLGEERKREAEIQRLREQKRQERIDAVKADIAKYEKIASSDFGKDLKTSAWKSLLEKYPDAPSYLPEGASDALLWFVENEVQTGRGVKADIDVYNKIASSNLSQDLKSEAWRRILKQYPDVPQDLEAGATLRLLWLVENKGRYEMVVNSIGMRFVKIEPGTFMMGSPSNEPGRSSNETQHRVTLTRGFYMGATEVTQGQWKKVMGSNPSYFKNCGDDCPVESVCWEDCQRFIRKLNRLEGMDKYRLPTEAEWEYACRAGTTTPFSFGNCLSADQANYNGKHPLSGCAKGQYHQKTVPVASFAPNAWGLYDMHGNVWEWCQDWYGDYPSGSVTDPTAPAIIYRHRPGLCFVGAADSTGRSSGDLRVYRGGGWRYGAGSCRSADRNFSTPGFRFYFLGLRLARNL